MRSALFVLAVAAACGPKVSTTPLTFDEDLESERAAEPAPVPTEAQRPVAPVGKGLRTGTIPRARLIAVLDAGPAQFLRQLEVAPRMNGDRFVGWQLVQLVGHDGPLVDVDVVPGDVLLAINGKPLSRPDQLQTIWDSLRTANAVQAQMWRGEAKFTLDFTIEPAVSALPVAPTTPTAPVILTPAKPAR
jgi:type II secretory pathway component PulC